jgi:hypothetical protein
MGSVAVSARFELDEAPPGTADSLAVRENCGADAALRGS